MSVDIKKLTVTTDDERKQWIEMLKLASDYHYDMAGQFTPEVIGDTEMEEVAKVHRAWGRAIQDAIALIDMWEVDTNDEVLTPAGAINVTPENE
jgi:isopropylmalate/homocitrate/citramalate synthase